MKRKPRSVWNILTRILGLKRRSRIGSFPIHPSFLWASSRFLMSVFLKRKPNWPKQFNGSRRWRLPCSKGTVLTSFYSFEATRMLRKNRSRVDFWKPFTRWKPHRFLEIPIAISWRRQVAADWNSLAKCWQVPWFRELPSIASGIISLDEELFQRLITWEFSAYPLPTQSCSII